MRAFATAPWVVLLLAAAALVSVPWTSASVSASVDPSGCNATQLATAIVKNCVEEFEPTNPAACCSSVLPTVDMADCLCLVVDEPQLALSGTTSQAVFSLYLKCGGKRRSQDKPYEACDDFFATPSLPAPASPSPPASPRDTYYPPTPANEDSSFKIELSTDVGVWVTVIVYVIVMCFAVYDRLTRGRNDNEGEQDVNNGQDPEGQANPRPHGAG